MAQDATSDVPTVGTTPAAAGAKPVASAEARARTPELGVAPKASEADAPTPADTPSGGPSVVAFADRQSVRVVIEFPWPRARTLTKTAVFALPFALACTTSLAAADQQVGWRVSGAQTAQDEAWMNSLVGPVSTALGASPLASVDPETPVLPVGGDPQNLVVANGAATVDPPVDPSTETTTLPPQIDPAAQPVQGETVVTTELAASGIPVRTLKAYLAAEKITARLDPGCHLSWSLLAGIGRVESNHGRFGGARIAATGDVSPPILGPRLTGGSGMAYIRDTDNGRLDGDTVTDRAMGPMQFIPGTWRGFGSDANGDGVANPQNVDDAALSAARYLCYGGGDLSTQADRWRAVLRYNYSTNYAAHVLALADSYATGKVVPLETPPPGVVIPVTVSPSTSPSTSPSASPSLSPSPSKSPSASPSASASASVSASVSASASSSASASASASGSASPSPAASGASGTPSATDSPSSSPSATDSPSSSPSATDTPSPTPTPTPTPADTTTPAEATTTASTTTQSTTQSATQSTTQSATGSTTQTGTTQAAATQATTDAATPTAP